MPDAPDFHHELSARRHARFNLVLIGVILGVLFTPAALIPESRTGCGWCGAAALLGLVALFYAIVFIPLVVLGGTYRVTLAAGVLRVESPHWIFGRSFEVNVSDIARLVVTGTTDGPERHIIHTHDGKEFHLDSTFTGRRHLPADELFAAIRRSNPDIPLVTEP